MKRYASRVSKLGAKAIKEQIINDLVILLHTYRSKCAAQSSPSQLILPDNLKLLPLYTLSTLKSPAFKLLGNSKLDEKVAWLQKLLSLPHSLTPYLLYPRIYRVTDIGGVDSGYGQYTEPAP
jgi:protein transport protein SEC24